MIFSYVAELATGKRRRNEHLRYLLLMKVLLRTGARVTEALLLKPTDIDFQVNTITLATLKKNIKDAEKLKPYQERKLPKRVLPLHPDLKDALMSYFLELHIDVKSGERIFPMARQMVNRYMSRVQSGLTARGYKVKINPHKFRHTFAVKALFDGVPINVVQRWLAHSSLLVTSVYANILSMDTAGYMKQVR